MVMIIMMMERLESVRWGGAPVTDCRLGSHSHESWFTSTYINLSSLSSVHVQCPARQLFATCSIHTHANARHAIFIPHFVYCLFWADYQKGGKLYDTDVKYWTSSS